MSSGMTPVTLPQPGRWVRGAFFYHIYPLGLCGAPEKNDFVSPAQPRIEKLYDWLTHAHSLGANALYLGPLFESSTHGYDTADYLTVDRRLGTNADLARLCRFAHDAGFRVILDAVFNHVGRDFWAFRDLRANGKASAYASWFSGLDFQKQSPLGDPFSYEAWNGHYSLVKLEARNPDVKAHLFTALARWVEEFGIDGLRLDAADCLDIGFLRELASFCRGRWPEFWLLGEIIHGDYRRWANPLTLDSVTNYECYKGLYSSHAEGNFFEIAWSLNRQFGPEGLYRDLPLYNFADNHDVDRVASLLPEKSHLGTLSCILFTMPGVPSVYYGSEWGIEGRKNHSDRPLRPPLDLVTVKKESPNSWLAGVIARLAEVRAGSAALTTGDYTQLHVASLQLAFLRSCPQESVIVAVNAGAQPTRMDLEMPGGAPRGAYRDLLEPGRSFSVSGGRLLLPDVPARWARVLSSSPTV
jgi:cyclomaltodextrinase / maltogenic alpha-amylase / neopullulanase